MDNEHQYDAFKPFEFHGQAFEYFKIWIVNILLTILTLGIYSPWAKVRTRRYLYGNTFLDNTAFDFVADPVKILIGRIIAVLVFILFSFSSLLPEEFETLVGLLFLAAIPWIVVKSLKFNLSNTTYRNIRFNFHGRYPMALYVYIVLPVLALFTLGLAYPFFIKSQKQFIIANSAFGTSHFDMNASAKEFYRLFIVPAALLLGMLIIIVVFEKDLLVLIPKSFKPELMVPYFKIAFYSMIPVLIIIYAYFYTQISNLIINHSEISNFQFISSLKTGRVVWLFISNVIAIMFSFGLMIPWAKIRFMRYRLSCLVLLGDHDLNEFVGSESERTAAIGEELGDLFDIDIGL